MSFDLCSLITRLNELQQQVYNLASLINNKTYSSIRSEFKVGEIISGGKAVYIDVDKLVYAFDINNPYHYDKYLGIAETASQKFGTIVVVIQGVSKVLGSGWVPGHSYFVGLNGMLTDIAPISGLCKAVGVGIDSDTICINNDLQVIQI